MGWIFLTACFGLQATQIEDGIHHDVLRAFQQQDIGAYPFVLMVRRGLPQFQDQCHGQVFGSFRRW